MLDILRTTTDVLVFAFFDVHDLEEGWKTDEKCNMVRQLRDHPQLLNVRYYFIWTYLVIFWQQSRGNPALTSDIPNIPCIVIHETNYYDSIWLNSRDALSVCKM